MDLTTWSIVGVIVVVVLNQLVLRLAVLWRNPFTFWGLQAFNLTLGVYLLIWGLPVLTHLPFLSILLGLLVILRVVQNNMIRANHLREDRQRELAEEKKKLAKFLAEGAEPRPAAPLAEPAPTIPGEPGEKQVTP